jgi:hypothetical protein
MKDRYRNRLTRATFFMLLLSLAFVPSVFGQRTWDGESDTLWNNPLNWDGNVSIPLAGQNVIIPAAGVTNEPTVNVVLPSFGTFEIQTGRTLTAGAFDLTTTSDLTVTGTLDSAGGLVTVGGGVTINGGALNLGANLDVAGAFTMSSGSFTPGANTVFVAGNWTVSGGTFTSAGSTVTMDSSFINRTLTTGGLGFNNLSLTNGTDTVSVSGALNVAGTLTVNPNQTLQLAGNTGTIANTSNSGTIRLQGDENITFTAGLATSGLVEYYGAGGYAAIGTNTPAAYFNLDFQGAGSFTLAAGIDVNGWFDVSAGTMDADTRTINLAGDWVNGAGTFNESFSTLLLDGGAAQILDADTFWNVTIANTVGGVSTPGLVTVSNDFLLTTGVVTLGGNLDVSGDLVINGGNLTVGANTVTASGLLDVNGVLTNSSGFGVVLAAGNVDFTGGSYAKTGLLRFNGGGAQQLTSATEDLGNIRTSTFGTNVQLQDTGVFDAVTIDFGTTLTTGANTMTAASVAAAGTLQAGGQTGAQTLTVSGAVSGSGAFTSGAGDVDINGNVTVDTFTESGGQTNLAGGTVTFTTFNQNAGLVVFDRGATTNLTSGGIYNDVTVGGGTTVVLQNNGTVGGALTVTGAVTVGTRTLTVNGALDVTGTLTNNNLAGVVIADSDVDFSGGSYAKTGLLRFDGGGVQLLTSDTQDLGRIRTSNAGTNVQLQDTGDFDSVTIDNLTTLTTGANTMTATTVAAAGTLNATGQTGAQALDVTGTVSGSGAFTSGAADVDINGNVTVDTFTESSGQTSLAGGTVTFTTFNQNGGLVVFNRGATTNLTSGGAYDDVTAGGGTTVVLQNDATVDGTLTVTGAVTVGTNTLTVSGLLDVNGTLTNSAGAGIVQAGGDVDLSTGTYAKSGLLRFNGGGAQDLTSDGNDLGNTQITVGGTAVTLQDDADIDTLTLTAGSLISSTSDMTVAGDWLVGAGTFTPGLNMVTLDGTVDQDVNPEAFANLTITGAGTVNTTGAVDVAGALNVSGGTLSLGGGLDVNGTLTVNGATLTDNAQTITAAGNINFTGGNTTLTGTLVLDGTTGLTSAGEVLNAVQIGTGGSGGILTLNDAAIVTGDITVQNGGLTTLNLTNQTLSAAGDVNLTNLDTFTVTNSTVVLNASGVARALTTDDLSFNNLTLSTLTDTVSVTDALNVAGTMTVDANQTLQLAGNTGTIATTVNNGTIRLQGNEVVTFTAGLAASGLVEYYGAGVYGNIGTNTPAAYFNLDFQGAGDFTLAADIDADGTFDVSNGTLDDNAQTITVAGNVNFTGGNLTLSGTLELNSGGAGQALTSDTETIFDLTVNSGGTVTTAGSTAVGNDLTMTAGNLSLGAAMTIGRDVLLTGGDLQPGGQTISVTRNWDGTGGGAFTYAGSTVDFIGGGTSQILGSNTFNNLSSAAANQVIQFDTTETTVVDNTLVINGLAAGTLITLEGTAAADWNLLVNSAGASGVSFARIQYGQIDDGSSADVAVTNSQDAGNNDIEGPQEHWAFTGQVLTWDAGAGTSDWTNPVNWSGDQYYPGAGDTAQIDFAAGGIPDVPAPEWLIRNLDVSGGGILNLVDSNELIITNNIDNAGTIYHYAASMLTLRTAAMDTDSGTVEYRGLGGAIQDFGATDYFNLAFNSAGQTFNSGAPLTLGAGGVLTVTDGDFTLAAADTVSAPGGVIIQAAGQLNLGTGSAVTTATGGDFTVNGTGVVNPTAATSTISVGGSVAFAALSALNTPGNTLFVFTGNTAETFDTGGVGKTMPEIDLQKSGGSLTLLDSLTQGGGLDLLFTNSAAVTLDLNNFNWNLGNPFVLNDTDTTVTTGTGTLNAAGNAMSVSAGFLTVGAIPGAATTNSTLTQSGGTITQDGNVTAASAALNGGSYDHNAGTLQTTGADLAYGGVAYDGTGGGNVTVALDGDIDVTGGTVDFGTKTVATSGAGDLTVTVGGVDFGTSTVTIGGTGVVNLAGGTIELASGDISTNNGTVQIAGAATTNIGALGTASINTSNSNTNVTILDSITGSGTLAINAGGGTVQLQGAQTFGGLTVSAADTTLLEGSFTTAAPDPGGLSITSTAIDVGVLVAFNVDTSANNGAIVMNGAVDIRIDATLVAGTGAPAISLPGTVFSTAVAPAADLTLTAIGEISFGGTVGAGNPIDLLRITNASNVSFASTVDVASLVQDTGTMVTSFDGNVTATGGVGIDIDTSGIQFNGLRNVSAPAGPITFTVAGTNLVPNGGTLSISTGNNLTIDGTGSVDSFGNEAVVITTAVDVDISRPVIVGSFTQSAGTGTTTLRENVTATAGDVDITTGALTLDGLTIDTSGGSGNVIINAATPTTLATADVVITTGAGIPGDITFTGTVNGARDLILTAGTGAIDFNLAVGDGVDPGDGTGAAITINSSGGTTFSLAVDLASGIVSAATGLTTFDDDVTITGGATDTAIDGSVEFTVPLTWSTTTTAVTFGDAAVDAFTTIGGALATINTSAGDDDVTINATSLISGDLVITAGTGAISIQAPLTRTALTDDLTLTSSGATTIGNAAQVGTLGARLGTVLIDGGGTLDIGSDIYATTITVANAATSLTADMEFNATGAVGFTGVGTSINGSGGADALTITSTLGAIDVDGAIGSVTTLDAVTVVAGTTVELSNIGGVGAGVIGATAVTAATGITFTGVTYNANVQDYDAGGPAVAIGVNAGAPTTFTSTNDNISFNGEIQLANGSNLTANSAGGTVTFDEVEGTSDEDFTVDAGVGLIDGAAIGTGILNGVNTVTMTASIATITGDIRTSNGLANSIIVNGNLVMDAGAPRLDTSTGPSGVTVTGTLTGTGANSLVINAGAGIVSNVTVGGAIGSGAEFANVTIDANIINLAGVGTPGNPGVTGTFLINTATNAVITGTADVGLFTQAAGTGTTTLQGNVTTTTGDVTITTNAVTLDGLTINTSAGSNNVTINAPTTTLATADVIITTGAGVAGDITFSGTVNGARDLILTAGTGAIVFSAAVGNGIDPGDGTGAAITVNSSNVVTGTTFSGTVDLASGIISTATGPTTFSGDVTVTGGNTDTAIDGSVEFTVPLTWTTTTTAVTIGDAAGDAFITAAGATTTIDTSGGGDNVTINATTTANESLIVTAGAGDIDILAPVGSGGVAANLVLSSSAATTVGNSAQIGTLGLPFAIVAVLNGGTFSIGSDVFAATIAVVDDAITLTADVELNATAAVSVSAAAATIDGGGGADALVISAGTTVTLAGPIGTATPLDSLTITGGTTVAVDDIGAGAAGVTGATAVTAVTGITFTGTTYNANQQTYSATLAANLLSVNGGPTTFTSTTDNITFTGEIRLADGSNLIIGTGAGGGNVDADDIRGNSLETVTMDAGAGTIAVGQIGSGDEIFTVDLTAADSTLNGNITTGNAAGNAVTITGDATLGTNVVLDTDINNGGVTITGDVVAPGNENLSILSSDVGLPAVGGDVTVGGSLGTGGNELGILVITGKDVTLTGIQTAAGAANTVSVTGRDGADTGSIRLDGTTYTSGGDQTYNLVDAAAAPSVSEWIAMNDGLGKSFNANAGTGTITFGELYIDLGGSGLTISVFVDVIARRLVHVGGTIDFNGNNLTTLGDFVAQGNEGPGYGANDPDRDPEVNEWIYPEEGLFIAVFGVPSNTARYADLAGTVVSVGEDFYVNGTFMDGAAWTLNLPAPGPAPDITAIATDPAKWGSPYAVAFNMTAENSVASEWVSAASNSSETIDTVVYNRTNNVTDAAPGGTNTNWDFTVPEIIDVRTVYDNVIRIEFNEPIRNVANEAWDAITTAVAAGGVGLNDEPGQVWVHDLGDTGGTLGLVLNDAWVDAFLTTPLAGAADTNVIYVEATGGTWNTDADGGFAGTLTNGVGAGDPLSTDSRNPPVSQTIDVSLHFIKGLFTDAQSRNAVPGYGGDVDAGSPDHPAGYVNTQDFTSPVLVEVLTGRHDHVDFPGNLWSYDSWDGHNFFELRYSEAVNFGGTGYLQAGADDGSIADDDPDRRAANTFTAASGVHGGYIRDDGAGTVQVEGYFNYSGTFTGGSTDVTEATSSLYRYPGLATSNTHHLRIFVKGWSDIQPFDIDPAGPANNEDFRDWRGYIDTASNPNGSSILVPTNSQIKDTSPGVNSPLPYDNPRYVGRTIADGTGGFPAGFNEPLDFDPPAVAEFRPNGNASPYREVYVALDLDLDDNGTDEFVPPDLDSYNRLEFHIQDNTSELDSWVSVPVATGDHTDVRTDHGVRDSMVRDAIDVFFITPEGTEPGAAVPWYSTTSNTDIVGFTTRVNNLFYNGDPPVAFVEENDDSYFAFLYDNGTLQLQKQTSTWIAYQPTPAVINATDVITDFAGNRLAEFEHYLNTEVEAPTIVVALGAVGSDRIYIRFSKAVGAVGAAEPEVLLPEDITIFSANGITVSSIVPFADTLIPGPTFDYVEEAWLILSEPLTADVTFTGRIRPSGPLDGQLGIQDPFGTKMDVNEVNRLTDVGIDVVVPVAAWNDIQDADTFGDEFIGVQLGEFDGSVALLDEDTTLQATIMATSHTDEPLVLYYDVVAGDEDFLLDTDTLGSSGGTRVWLPIESSLGDDRTTEEELELLPHNDDARRLTPTTTTGALREYHIPANDREITEGVTLEFLFTLDGLPVVTAADPDDPRTLMPWSIGYRRFIEQRSGVTILNNVIYPENGDQTVLTYEVPRAGMVTINVFTLDGQLVKTLVRGRQGEGRQIVSWDGFNASGQMVASGLYFIRVVAPDIDEIRKVLVAK